MGLKSLKSISAHSNGKCCNKAATSTQQKRIKHSPLGLKIELNSSVCVCGNILSLHIVLPHCSSIFHWRNNSNVSCLMHHPFIVYRIKAMPWALFMNLSILMTHPFCYHAPSTTSTYCIKAWANDSAFDDGYVLLRALPHFFLFVRNLRLTCVLRPQPKTPHFLSR